jgi:hypothetical protein
MPVCTGFVERSGGRFWTWLATRAGRLQPYDWFGRSWPLTKAFGSLRSAPPWSRPITFAAFAYRLGLLGDFFFEFVPEMGFLLQDSMNQTQNHSSDWFFRVSPWLHCGNGWWYMLYPPFIRSCRVSAVNLMKGICV